MGVGNPKAEFRNPKEIRMTNDRNPKIHGRKDAGSINGFSGGDCDCPDRVPKNKKAAEGQPQSKTWRRYGARHVFFSGADRDDLVDRAAPLKK